MHRFSCMFDPSNESYETGVLEIIAMGEDKDDNLIISNVSSVRIGDVEVLESPNLEEKKFDLLADWDFLLIWLGISLILLILIIILLIYIFRIIRRRRLKSVELR